LRHFISEKPLPKPEKSRMDQATQKMKVSEDPSRPEMQQAAAKQANCKKEAKAKKLQGSARKAFMKDCIK
jgi:psiF repeat